MIPMQSMAAVQASLQAALSSPVVDSTPAAGSEIFGGMWHAAAAQIQQTSAKAQEAVTGLLSGQGVEVHDAIIATQKADMTFELALQVRNKAVGAYQQMMSMQF